MSELFDANPHDFYEDSLCWLGRPREAYRLLSEGVLPRLSTWLRGQSDTKSVRDWQPGEVRPILYPVATFGEKSALLTCEALLLCGSGSYYNPCDLAVLVFVQRPDEKASQLLQRLRCTEAIIRQGADVSVEQVNLSKSKRDYINSRFLIWPYRFTPSQEETCTEQGFSLVRFAPAALTPG